MSGTCAIIIKCQSCGKRESVVHLTEIRNGKKTEMHLCAQCAEEKGITHKQHFDISELLQTLSSADAPPKETGRCGGLFEKVTERVRKVMALARQEAEGLNHDYIGTEHMLLGLVREGTGVAAKILEQLGIDVEEVRTEVEKLLKQGPEMVPLGLLPFTPLGKRALELAYEESRGLEHDYVGTAHLLLGLLGAREGMAARVLTDLGLKYEELKKEVADVIGPGPPPKESEGGELAEIREAGPPPEGGMFHRFTQRARKVMDIARQEAERLNHDYIGTEHVLLALVKEGTGVAANVLENLDLALDDVRLEIEGRLERGPEMVSLNHLVITLRGKRALELAYEEARALKHDYVGSEHLLLALIREGEGVAAQVLTDLGLKYDDVKKEIIDMIGGFSPEES